MVYVSWTSGAILDDKYQFLSHGQIHVSWASAGILDDNDQFVFAGWTKVSRCKQIRLYSEICRPCNDYRIDSNRTLSIPGPTH